MRHRGGVRAGKKIPHAVVVAQRRQSIEITRQDAFPRKKLQHSLGPRLDCALPYHWLNGSARIQWDLGEREGRF